MVTGHGSWFDRQAELAELADAIDEDDAATGYREPGEDEETGPMATTDWPYDAVQDDPLTALRIPVVRNPYPGWKYEVCVVIADDDAERSYFGPALRPDERETAQILAELEWRMRWYNDGWAAKMRRRPLDTDSSTNTVVLLKRAESNWAYRRMSWTTGPLLVPTREMQPETLEQVLDRCNDYGGEPNPKWREFKAAHPDAFGGGQ